MTDEQLRGLAPALAAFLRKFESHFANPQGVRHFQNYTRCLLSDMERKTAEPMALLTGVPVRNVQQFLKAVLWDHDGLVNDLQKHLVQSVSEFSDDGLGTVAIIDETSVLKKGDKTPGVQRQYLGCVGKVDNGIVTVHLAVAKGRFKTLLDGELFLPESWDKNKERRDAADIPVSMRYRSKWKIAYELYSKSLANGWTFDWMTFDEGYGSKPAFMKWLDLASQQYVGEVPKSFSVRTGRGTPKCNAEALFQRPGVNAIKAQTFRMSQETGAPMIWEAKAVDVSLGMEEHPRHRLIKARNCETGEVKYFMSRSNKRVDLEVLLRVGFSRWHVEHLFRVAKSEIGLTHFEGRSYVSLKRHLALCMTAMAFVSLHTMRLRKKKSGPNIGASLPGSAPEVPEISTKATGHDREQVPA